MAYRIPKFRRKKKINAIRVAMKIISTIIALWIGGFAYNIVYGIIANTSSPMFPGLKLVGFLVNTVTNSTAGATTTLCGTESVQLTDGAGSHVFNCVTGLANTSLLAVVGVLAVFWIVFEFVDVSY